MKKAMLIGIAAVAAMVLAVAPTALAGGAKDGDRVIKRGKCSVASTWKLKAKSDDGPVFLVELTYGGLFELVNIPADSLQLLLQVECPRLLFPFARRVVADATRDGGFPPLMIDPIDFLTLYRRKAQAGTEVAQA